MSQNLKLGKIGEQIAAHFLVQKGYEIVMQNFWTRVGEIDIVAQDHTSIVFVEVKTSSELMHGLPEQAVHYQKQRRLRKTISAYLSKNQIENFRIDVVAISQGFSSKKILIRHHKAVLNIF